MKKVLFILSGILSFQFALAQAPEIEWEQSYNISNLDVWWHGSVNTPDNGYIFTGKYSEWQGDEYGVLTKLNSAGEIEWQKNYNDSHISDITQTADGGYATIGIELSDSEFMKSRLIKHDADGIEQWSKTFELAGYHLDLRKILSTPDGGFLIAGTNSQNNWGSGDFYVIKTSSNGAVLWQRSYGGTDTDNLTDIALSPEGFYFLTGYTYSNDGDVEPNNEGGMKVWVLKINPNGTIVWQHVYPGAISDMFYFRITETSETGCAVLSSTYTGGARVIRLAPDGTTQWDKTFNPGYDSPFFNTGNIVRTADDKIVFGGDFHKYGDEEESVLKVYELNLDGEINWETDLGIQEPWYYHNTTLISTNDNGFLITGQFGTNVSAVKLLHDNLSVSQPNQFINNTIIYPNPSNGNFTVKSQKKISSVKISDLSGKTVYTDKVSAVSKSFNLEERLQSGIYIVEIQFENGNKETKKIIIRK